jgi:fucose permease
VTSVIPRQTALWILSVGFVATGMVTTMLGPLMPWLTQRWGISDAAAGGLTGGRALGAAHLTRYSEDRAAVAGLMLAGCWVLILLAASRPGTVTIAALVGGLGLSVVFPVTVAAMTRELPNQIAGPLVAFGGVGGATIPWFVGFLSSRADSLKVGLATLFVADVLLLCLHAVRLRGSRASHG